MRYLRQRHNYKITTELVSNITPSSTATATALTIASATISSAIYPATTAESTPISDAHQRMNCSQTIALVAQHVQQYQIFAPLSTESL